MRRIALTFLAALLPLSALHAAGGKQSTIVDMTRQTGPSKFVTSTDGKPVELGAPGQGAPDVAPDMIKVIPVDATAAGRAAPDNESDAPGDKEPPQKQGPDGQPQASRQPAAEVPADQQPASRPPGGEQAAANQPAAAQAPTNDPPADQPSSDKPPAEAESPAATGDAPNDLNSDDP